MCSPILRGKIIHGHGVTPSTLDGSAKFASIMERSASEFKRIASLGVIW